jgi:hypothetical protein
MTALMDRTRSGYPRKSLDEQIAHAKRDVRRFYDTNPAEYRAAERRLARLLARRTTREDTP